MLIIAGLGNPGDEHANNRHNAGFMAVDEIARRHSFSPWKNRFRSQIAEGKLTEERTLLLKPQTMMNNSGAAIGDAMRFYRVAIKNVMVIYDELDLEPARIRFKTGGGAGGHNGVKSIISHCGEDFHRLRIGIGHPGDQNRVTRYVLGNFTKTDMDTWLLRLLQAIGEYAVLMVRGDKSTFMNKISLFMKDEEKIIFEPARKQSHDHPLRQAVTGEKSSRSGPMAEKLKKLSGSGNRSGSLKN